MSDLDDVVQDFLVESYEGLDQLDSDLLALEKDPSDSGLIASIFRTIHTIKGTCGFLGFERLERVTHVGENLLSKLRDGERAWTSEVADVLLKLVDATRAMLSEIESSGAEGAEEYAELVEILTRLHSGEDVQLDGAASDTATVDSSEEPTSDGEAAEELAAAGTPEPATQRGADQTGEALVKAGIVSPADVEQAKAQQEAGDGRSLADILVGLGAVDAESAAKAIEEHKRTSAVANSTIRVDVGLLDSLMNLVGELVLARNQILQHTSGLDDQGLLATAQRLNHVTFELQESVMKTRMQPIGGVWGKFPRIIRDLASSVGKQVELHMSGTETELDKTIIEAIKDPMTHIVRNSVDHGLESPRERVAAGKSATGRVELRAYHEGGRVNIEISDDGRGLDPEKLKAKAIEKGVVTAEAASRMSPRELTNLIFAPGFSTAEKVTNISGRGVGMDVVRTNIEKIGGTLDLSSEVGKGTKIEIKIPLTLAIVPALIVEGRGERFAIPQLSLVELVRLEGQEVRTKIEQVHGTPIYRLRGQLLPIVDLAEVLGLDPRAAESEAAVHIAVLQTDGMQFGLVVDEVADTEEIVVKPLGRQLKSLQAYAGATIMGDGQVALILDTHGLAELGGLGGDKREQLQAKESTTEMNEPDETFLIVRVGESDRLCVKSSEVERLEEFDSDRVESSGGQKVVQYRGEIVPLIDVGPLLGIYCERDESMPIQVMMVNDGGTMAGLVVDEIVDIVQDHVDLKPAAPNSYYAGRAVIQDKVTDVLDVLALMQTVSTAAF
jgi:two-component system chemotaxis sensor kinase CheA